MAKEICISSTPHETRLAILEDDQLAEIYYERENEYTLAGSIYNGRVTRVLPGMQSAFVDIGLERDAFLYVTDFLELEDPEETDELEKAAISGGNQAPREVRHTAVVEKTAPRGDERPSQKPEQKQEAKPEARQEPKQESRRDRADRPAQDRPAKEQRRLAVEAVSEVASAPEVSVVPESAENDQEEGNEPGAKRWRGRRRRRGGRGAVAVLETRTESAETPASNVVQTPIFEELEEVEEVEEQIAPIIQASAAPEYAPTPEPASRASQTQTPFVLPGESLSKYGGTPAGDQPKAAPVVARPASSFKPSTMIQAPLAWDGSGLLPGESLSKHRKTAPLPVVEVDAEPQGVFADADQSNATKSVEEQIESASEPFFVNPAFLEEIVDFAPESVGEATLEVAPEAAFSEAHFDEEEFEEEDLTEEVSEVAPAPVVAEEHVASAEYDVAEEHVAERENVAAEEAAPEADAAASHHIDPVPPAEFRLFGLGKKKKDEEAKPTAQAEEDFIEEEEFAAPKASASRPAKPSGRNDAPAPRTVAAEEPKAARGRNDQLASMMQEANRIQLEEGGFDGDDDEEEEDEPTGQSAAPGQKSQDRNGRGRRGRGGAPNQQAPMGQNRGRGGQTRRSSQLSDLPVISDLLKPGQEILVQIAKEPIAKKGARITSHIALPGRFLVFMPTVTHVGVSRKIESDEERQRLKRILISERGEASGGFIVRTAAEDASEEDLRADLRFLLHLWNEIKTRSDSSKSPALIYHDLSLIERILRDQVSSNFSNIWVDSEADYERIVRFLNRFSPSLVRRVKLYNKEVPLFEHFGIQDEISKALRSKVWLKSGGSIVINQTEALVAIDINTGKYVGKSARLEDTIVKTNLDAVPEIVRQIRLRDLGGIIVIDFIDMDDRKNRFRVMAALEEALKSDRAPTKVLQFNDFGLVAITRKRVKQSLERTLSVPCPTCQATGMVKSPTTVCNEIYTELRKMKKHFEGEDVMLRVHPETVKVLKANNASWLTEFEELVGKNILVKSDPTLHPEQFDVQG